jgi:hypothetical protein
VGSKWYRWPNGAGIGCANDDWSQAAAAPVVFKREHNRQTIVGPAAVTWRAFFVER